MQVGHSRGDITTSLNMSPPRRYVNFLLSITTDDVIATVEPIRQHIIMQTPKRVQYTVCWVLGKNIYITISFTNGRHVGGVEKDFRGWIANGFAKFQEANTKIPQEAEMLFSFGESHQQGARNWNGETNTRKRTRKDLEHENEELKGQTRNLTQLIQQADMKRKDLEHETKELRGQNRNLTQSTLQSDRTRKDLERQNEELKRQNRDLVQSTMQTEKTTKARENICLRLLDEYLTVHNYQGAIRVLGTIHKFIQFPTSRPPPQTIKDAFLCYHPDKFNARNCAKPDQDWGMRISEVVTRHLSRWKEGG